VAEYIPVSFPGQVKIAVVSEVYWTRPVHRGPVIRPKLVRSGQPIGYFRPQVSGVALIPMGTFQSKAKKNSVFILVGFGLPNNPVKALPPAVETVVPIVLEKRVVLAIQGKTPVGYPVPETSDSRADIRSIVEIPVKVRVTEENIIPPAAPGRYDQRDPRPPKGTDGEGQIPRLQGVKANFLPGI
jgi:hypothetical protein